MSEQALYERLGGVFAIAAVVDHFSDAIVQNPILGQRLENPERRAWHTKQLLSRLEVHATLWACNVAGGTFSFAATKPGSTPLGLEEAHRTSRSLQGSSMRSQPSWHVRSTTSGFLRVRKASSWLRSLPIRAKWREQRTMS